MVGIVTETNTLFTGRDILAAQNYLRCIPSTLSEAVEAVQGMPTQVVARLALHVKANADSALDIAQKARA